MEKCLHYCWEIASSYPNNTTAFHGWQSREKNWPCSLGGRNGITPCPLSITAMLANHYERSVYELMCGRGQIAEYVMNPHDAARAADSLGKDLFGWLHVSRRKHVLAK